MKIWFTIFSVLLLFTVSCSSPNADGTISVSIINSAFSNHDLKFPDGSVFLFLESKHGLTSEWASLKVEIPKDKLNYFIVQNGFSKFEKKSNVSLSSYSDDPKWDIKGSTEVFESSKTVIDKINPKYPWFLMVVYKEPIESNSLTFYLSSIKHYN